MTSTYEVSVKQVKAQVKVEFKNKKIRNQENFRTSITS